LQSFSEYRTFRQEVSSDLKGKKFFEQWQTESRRPKWINPGLTNKLTKVSDTHSCIQQRERNQWDN